VRFGPQDVLMMQIVGAFAEFEREMLRERTKSGLHTARAEGRTLGRPAKFNTHQKQEIVRLVKSGQQSAADAARLFNVHPSTVARLLAQNQIKPP